MKGDTQHMKILNFYMSKSRKFHINILGNTIDDCIKFLNKLNQLPSINPITVSMHIDATDEGQFEGSIICKSSNYKKFSQELKELIDEYSE